MLVTVNPGPRDEPAPLISPAELLEPVRVNPASPRWDDPVGPPAADDLDDADALNDADEG
jgi:hypothetical protein